MTIEACDCRDLARQVRGGRLRSLGAAALVAFALATAHPLPAFAQDGSLPSGEPTVAAEPAPVDEVAQGQAEDAPAKQDVQAAAPAAQQEVSQSAADSTGADDNVPADVTAMAEEPAASVGDATSSDTPAADEEPQDSPAASADAPDQSAADVNEVPEVTQPSDEATSEAPASTDDSSSDSEAKLAAPSQDSASDSGSNTGDTDPDEIMTPEVPLGPSNPDNPTNPNETDMTETPEVPADSEEPVAPPKKNGWDATHTHYYVDDVAQTGVVSIVEGGQTRHYLFNGKGVLMKNARSVVGKRIYVTNAKGQIGTLVDAAAKQGFIWLSKYGGTSDTQRYYLYRDAKTGACYAVAGYSTDGAAHYTRPEGFLVRYHWKNTATNRIFIANKNGALAKLANGALRGWLISKAFEQGSQRYYLYRVRTGAAAGLYYAKPGYSTDGYPHYTRPEGYVVRGVYLTGTKRGSRIYLANSKGELASLPAGKNAGWVNSSSWGAKDKRYLLLRDMSGPDKGVCYTTLGFSTRAYAHYTTRRGYVQTSTWTVGGKTIVVNRLGKIAMLPSTVKTRGWLTSSSFVSGKKLYYLYRDNGTGLTSGACYAKAGYSTDGFAHLTTAKGYVAVSEIAKDPKTGISYMGNHLGKAVKATRANIINGYLSWAVGINNDSRYGYSQFTRWTGADEDYVEKHGGGDFDCASFVITALRKVGLKTGTADSTYDMIEPLTKLGWKLIRYNGKASQLQRGDILIHPVHHTELYLGTVNGKPLRIGAHSDEHGGIGHGAKLGDQKQHGTIKSGSYDFAGEISARDFVGNWFTHILRYEG